MRTRRNASESRSPLRLDCLLRIRWGEGGRRSDEVSAGEWEEGSRARCRQSADCGLWTSDFGLQENCTISAPLLHRFLHLLGKRSLIINDLQNFLHRDIVSPSFIFQASRFTAPFLHHSCTVSSPILPCSRRAPIDYQPLTKLFAPRHFCPTLHLPLRLGRGEGSRVRCRRCFSNPQPLAAPKQRDGGSTQKPIN